MAVKHNPSAAAQEYLALVRSTAKAEVTMNAERVAYMDRCEANWKANEAHWLAVNAQREVEVSLTERLAEAIKALNDQSARSVDIARIAGVGTVTHKFDYQAAFDALEDDKAS